MRCEYTDMGRRSRETASFVPIFIQNNVFPYNIIDIDIIKKATFKTKI